MTVGPYNIRELRELLADWDLRVTDDLLLVLEIAAWKCPECGDRAEQPDPGVASTQGRTRHVKCRRAGCPGTGKISL